MSKGYEEFLSRNGFTENAIRKLMASLPAPVDNEETDRHFEKGLSSIQGEGMFAVADIAQGAAFPASQKEVRFSLARYVNHSDTPNSEVNYDAEQNGWMVALHDIEAGEEITFDYEDNMRKAIALAVVS